MSKIVSLLSKKVAELAQWHPKTTYASEFHLAMDIPEKGEKKFAYHVRHCLFSLDTSTNTVLVTFESKEGKDKLEDIYQWIKRKGVSFEILFDASMVRARTGLFVLFGEARSGKTIYLKNVNAPYISSGEPIVGSLNVDLVIQAMTLLGLERLVEGTLSADNEIYVKKLPRFDVCIDSIRELMYTASGNTLPRGINAGFFLRLSNLSRLFEAAQIGCLASVNPMEMIPSDQSDEDVFSRAGLLRAILGSCSGVLTELAINSEGRVTSLRSSLRREAARKVVLFTYPSEGKYNFFPVGEKDGIVRDELINESDNNDEVIETDVDIIMTDIVNDVDSLYGINGKDLKG